jgi:hypothetical protein
VLAPASVLQPNRLDLGLGGRPGSGRVRGGRGPQQGGDPLDRGRIVQLDRNVALRAGDLERVPGAGREAVELAHDRAVRMRLPVQRSPFTESRGDRQGTRVTELPVWDAQQAG